MACNRATKSGFAAEAQKKVDFIFNKIIKKYKIYLLIFKKYLCDE